jgi:hypothetical protein
MVVVTGLLGVLGLLFLELQIEVGVAVAVHQLI